MLVLARSKPLLYGRKPPLEASLDSKWLKESFLWADFRAYTNASEEVACGKGIYGFPSSGK